PQEAVRLLRRAAATGGGAEVLARGALGEIYLEEFGDLDGAEHEFRTVLHAVPGLPAAELGLARVLHEAGDRRGELQALGRAVEGLSHDVAGFRERKAAGEPLPAGVEEVVLTLLEVALERARLDPDQRIDEDLLRWAEQERLFDALREEDEDPQQDWVRFHSLWTQLRQLLGRPEEAARALAQAGPGAGRGGAAGGAGESARGARGRGPALPGRAGFRPRSPHFPKGKEVAQASASPIRSCPKNSSDPTRQFGAPKIPDARARSV